MNDYELEIQICVAPMALERERILNPDFTIEDLIKKSDEHLLKVPGMERIPSKQSYGSP